jgi:hypothetical protein
MDTQPPPATAFLDAMLCSDVRGTAARARLEVIEHPLTMTFGMSKAAMAPPQVEHGWTVEFGQPLACPTAELPTKLLSCTRRNKPLPGPVTEIAPPLAALQLKKLHCETVMLLPIALTAPPLNSELAHWRKVIPVMVTVELITLKAAPSFCGRSLQLKTVADGIPVINSTAMLLRLTVGSRKIPAASVMTEAFVESNAWAMVLQGGLDPQESESTPFSGSTVAEATGAA